MRPRDPRADLQHGRPRAGEDPVAGLGVALHRRSLGGRQRARLAADVGRHGRVPDVVHRARRADEAAVAHGQAQPRREPPAQLADGGDVGRRLRVGGLGRHGQPADRLVLRVAGRGAVRRIGSERGEHADQHVIRGERLEDVRLRQAVRDGLLGGGDVGHRADEHDARRLVEIARMLGQAVRLGDRSDVAHEQVERLGRQLAARRGRVGARRAAEFFVAEDLGQPCAVAIVGIDDQDGLPR